MTVIKPQRNDAMTRMVMFALLGLTAFCAVILVLLYNRAVNIQHAAADAQDQIKKLELESAELQDGVFAIFTNAHIEAFAAERGFVKDKSPRYLEVGLSRTP